MPGRSGVRARADARGSLVALGLIALLLLGIWVFGRVSGSHGASGAVASSPATGSSARQSSARQSSARQSSARRSRATDPGPVSRLRGVPQKVYDVLAAVDATGRAPAGYVGGRQYLNDGRGGTQRLPVTAPDGSPVGYHEYDVNPYTSGVSRGPQRLVVGSDGSAWYTADHYDSWTQLR